MAIPPVFPPVPLFKRLNSIISPRSAGDSIAGLPVGVIGTSVSIEDTLVAGQINASISNTGSLLLALGINAAGGGFVASATALASSSSHLLLSSGESGNGISSGSSGVEIERGSATNYVFEFRESDDTFRAGLKGATKAAAFREEAPVEGGISFWTASIDRFKTNTNLLWDDTNNRLGIGKTPAVALDVSGAINCTTLNGRTPSADGSKLDGIASGADVTELENVRSAGAVIASDTDASNYGFVLDEDNFSSNSATQLASQQSIKAYIDSAVNNGIQTSATDTSGFAFVLDEDNFSSNSDTKLATQQSIKTYVDNAISNVGGGGGGGGNGIQPTATDTSGFAFVLDEDNFSSNSDTKLATQQSIKKYVDDEALKKADIALGNLSAENVTSALTKLNVNTKTEDTTALNLKVNTSDVIDEDDFSSDSDTKLATQQSIKSYADAIDTALKSLFAGAFRDRGAISSTAGLPNSGILKGHFFRVSVDFTFIGESVVTGDAVVALKDTPSSSVLSDWFILHNTTSGGGGGGGTPDDESVGADQIKGSDATAIRTKLDVNSKGEDTTALNLKFNNSGVIDEDDFSSDSDTKVPTQQSAKKYITDEALKKADIALGNLSAENVTSALTKLNVNTKTEDTTALNLKVNTSDVIDEDDFSSDSDTKLATQQSIKSYADAINTSLSTLITAETSARTDADTALAALVGIENWTGAGGVSTIAYSQDQLVIDGLTDIVYRAVSGRPVGTTRPTLDTVNWRVAHADNIIGVSSTNISADTTFANSSARVFVTPPAEGLTLTLPSSPDYGVQFEILAIGGVSGRSITIDPNGNELQGSSDDFVINESRFTDTLVSDGTNWHFLSHYQRLFDVQSSTTTLEGSNRFQVNSLLVGATGTIFEENADDFTNLETNVSRTTNSVSNATGVTSIDFALSANGGSSSAADASLHTVNDGGSGLQNRLNVMISGDATPLGEDSVVLVNGSINYIRIQSTQFFTLDLGENKTVSMFIFKHLSIDYGSNGWGGTRNLKIEGSTDNSNFTTLIDGDISTFSRVKDVHYETATLTFTEGSYRYIKATWDDFGVRDSDQTGLPNNPFADVLYSAGVKGLGFAYEDNAFDIEIVNESSIIAPASLIIKNESGVELTDSEYLITHKVNGGDFGTLAIPSVFKALAPITAGANFYLKASIIGGANIADASISTPVTNTQFSSDALKTQTINGVVQEYNYRGSYIEVYLSASLAETSGDSATLTGRIQFDQEDDTSNVNSDFTNADGIVTCNFEGKVNIKAFLIALAGSGVTGSRPSYEIIKNADDASQSTERLLLVGNADESKFTNINSETTIDVESGDTIVLSHELASADISVQVGSKMILTRIRG